MLKNLKVSTKLFAVLVAPVVVLVLLAVIGITQRNADAQDAARTAELAEFTETTSDVVSALERENILSSAYVGAQTRANRTAGEGSPTAADDKIYMMDHRGTVFVAAANGAEFKLLGSAPLGDEGDNNLRSSVAVSQGQVFVRTGKTLYCVGKK